MTREEAVGKVFDACCVPDSLKLELIGYIMDGEDPDYAADTARKLSEGFMQLTDNYWRSQRRREDSPQSGGVYRDDKYPS